AQAPAGITGISLLPSAGTPQARVLVVPYVNERVVVNGGGGLFSTYVCRFRSHCTRLRPGGSVDAETGAASAFGELAYLPNSADEYHDLSEVLYITASPRLLDVTPTFPARSPTPGRAQVSGRVVFDHWRMAEGDGLERQMRIMDGCGMHDMLAILHTWMHYGYDRKQPQFTPANPQRWTEQQFVSAIAACGELGWRVAVHENYNHMDWDSPYNSPTPATEFGEPLRPGDPGPEEAARLVASAPGEDLSRQPRNAWAFARLADLRVAPGPLSRPEPPAFPISSDKMLFYSQIESHKIREMYGTTAGYLDVSPCVQPGVGTWDLHIDLDARNREARGFDQVYRNAARQFAHHRDIFEIATGEGGDNATYNVGYIHAVERQVRSKMNTPIIPHFELAVIRPLSLHHGMGYYSRYFDADADSSTWDWDLYRAMSIAFGHAGFVGDTLLPAHIPGPEAIRHYYTMWAMQAAYADAPLEAIEYDDAGRWISVEEGLARGYDFTRARLRLRYGGGLQIAVNFDDEVWPVEVGGRQFALPRAGYAAVCEPEGLVVYSAVVSGVHEDCARCARYEYRHRRQVGGADQFAHHVVASASGLPGLADREAPGLLVCLSDRPEALAVRVPDGLAPQGRLNLTVINAGDEITLPVNIEGIAIGAVLPVTTYRGVERNRIALTATWTPPAAGEWAIALACTYTDPGHMDAAGAVPVQVQFPDAHLVVADGAPATAEVTHASAGRRGDFIEIAADLRFPAASAAGKAVAFAFDKLQFGETNDDDYARDVRLVLTNVATGERTDVIFPEAGDIERVQADALGEAYLFPAHSVTTFEIG
ncbi:MAG TPA: hypothetical protein VM283_02100, partial [Armatimonadota bacterium]|nr:hypothetical protein [Armatimonadota bacterium]